MPVAGVSTDTRTLRPGELFVALVGERFDGHQFVSEAVARGAAALVVEPARLAKAGFSFSPGEPDSPGEPGGEGGARPVPVIEVEDTLQALQHIAAGHIASLDVTVVGVSGSTGKTTTKDLLAAVLGGWKPTVKSFANWNNELGVPLTLLQAGNETAFAVVEMGMRGPGELAALCRIARPRIGVLTNIGPVHVGRLGSLEAVAAAKAELIEALPEDGAAVLNGDDPWCRRMADRTRAEVLWYGQAAGAALRLVEARPRGLEGIDVRVASEVFPLDGSGEGTLYIPVPGRHHAYNGLAAALTALQLGCPWAVVKEGLARSAAERSGMRMAVVALEGVTVIDDAYNASPPSMAAALAALAEAGPGRKVAVLGDMLELGDYAEEAHRAVGRQAAQHGVEVLLAVGAFADTVAAGARDGGLDARRIFTAADAREAARLAPSLLQRGDICLVKASRGVQLEHVVDALKEAWGQGARAEGDTM